MKNANRIRIGALLGAMLLAPALLVTYLALMGAYSPTFAPQMGWYLGPQCVPNFQCFFTPANTQQAVNCSWTSGSPTVNCATSHFVAADAGKRGFGFNSCSSFINLSAGSNLPISTTAILTISTVNSATQVTLSGNAASTGGAGNTGCFIWGTPDDAGAAAMDAAMQAAPNCPKGFLAAAYFMWTTPHFFVNPTACLNLGTSYPNGGGLANVFYSAGEELEGRGTGNTVVFLTPAFPESGTCTHGVSGKACFVVPVEGRWRDMQFTGGGDWLAPNVPANANLQEIDGPASLDNFTQTNFGGGSTGTWGIGAYYWAQLYQVNNSGFGHSGMADTPFSVVTAIKLAIENTDNWDIGAGFLADVQGAQPGFDKYNFICYDCRLWPGKINASALLVNAGGVPIKLYHSSLSPNGLNLNNIFGYYCFTTNGCLLDAQDTYIDMGTGVTGTGNIAVQCVSVTCTNIFHNTILKGSSGGAAYVDTAGSVLNDQGGNSFVGGTTILGTLIADGHSLKGICTGSATASSTLGLYGTGPNAVTTTCTSTTIGLGTPVSGARTLQNLVCTVGVAGTTSSTCTAVVNGSASTITCNIAAAATSCQDGTHTVFLSDGDRVSIEFISGAATTPQGVKAIVEWN